MHAGSVRGGCGTANQTLQICCCVCNSFPCPPLQRNLHAVCVCVDLCPRVVVAQVRKHSRAAPYSAAARVSNMYSSTQNPLCTAAAQQLSQPVDVTWNCTAQACQETCLQVHMAGEHRMRTGTARKQICPVTSSVGNHGAVIVGQRTRLSRS